MKTTTDYLERTHNGTSFVGSDVDIFALTLLAKSIDLSAKHGINPTRGVSLTSMLKQAATYTNKAHYTRKQHAEASANLLALADELKQAPRSA